jgi:hypothetical protein
MSRVFRVAPGEVALGRSGRLLAVAVLGAGAVAVSGCGPASVGRGADPATGGADHRAAPSPTRWPAGIAGGACQLLDFDVIASALGAGFDVAAASQAGATYTCVLERTGQNLPDLTLSVTATKIDVNIFKSKVVPKGAAAVAELGKSGYSAAVPAGSGAGPGAEVGWLSGNQRIMVLRLRTPADTAAADAADLMPKLVALAKRIDLTTV